MVAVLASLAGARMSCWGSQTRSPSSTPRWGRHWVELQVPAGSCPWGPLIHRQSPGEVSGQVGRGGWDCTEEAVWTILPGGARGRRWHLASDFHPHLCPCPQGATRQGLSPWCPCSGSAPGPTSSPTACPLLSSAVPPRPWTCLWRATPSSRLWQPKPSGVVPGRGGTGWGWGSW